MSGRSSVGRSVRSLRGPVRPRPRPGARATLAALLAVPLLAGVVLAPSASAADDVRTEDARVPSGSGADAVELDTTLYLPAGGGRAPAVVVAHGFGGSKDSVAGAARDLADRGYVVLTYSARGFGRSTGQIGLDDPRYEVADLSTLIDLLAERDDVQLDGDGDPRVGVTGGSYGGALTLLGAAYDDRIDAIAPQITWNSLTSALFPSQTGEVDAETVAATPEDGDTGVYKRLWSGLFFGVGTAPGGDLLGALAGGDGAAPDLSSIDTSTLDPAVVEQALTCGRFRADICAAYQTTFTGVPFAAIPRALASACPRPKSESWVPWISRVGASIRFRTPAGLLRSRTAAISGVSVPVAAAVWYAAQMSARNRPQVSACSTTAGSSVDVSIEDRSGAAPSPPARAPSRSPPGAVPTPKKRPDHSRL